MHTSTCSRSLPISSDAATASFSLIQASSSAASLYKYKNGVNVQLLRGCSKTETFINK